MPRGQVRGWRGGGEALPVDAIGGYAASSVQVIGPLQFTVEPLQEAGRQD